MIKQIVMWINTEGADEDTDIESTVTSNLEYDGYTVMRYDELEVSK